MQRTQALTDHSPPQALRLRESSASAELGSKPISRRDLPMDLCGKTRHDLFGFAALLALRRELRGRVDAPA